MGSKVTEMVRRRRSIAVVLVVAALAATGWAASTAAGKSQEDVTLTVSLFGDFGYHDLYEQYEAAHPGVTIKESIQDFAVHHSNLAKSVAGAPVRPTSRRSKSGSSRSSSRSPRTS
jgi:ABC-type glycerol-3-phosphate transport system substrate-binding protein